MSGASLFASVCFFAILVPWFRMQLLQHSIEASEELVVRISLQSHYIIADIVYPEALV